MPCGSSRNAVTWLIARSSWSTRVGSLGHAQLAPCFVGGQVPELEVLQRSRAACDLLIHACRPGRVAADARASIAAGGFDGLGQAPRMPGQQWFATTRTDDSPWRNR